MPAFTDVLLTKLTRMTIKRWLVSASVPVMLLGLSGCVTETRYANSNKPVVQKKTDNQDAAKTRIALALQYLGVGNNTQAKYNLDRALSLAPKLPESHYALAYYFEQVGENEKAENSYIQALKFGPNDPNTRNNYGTFLCRIGEYDKATEQFFKAIDIPSYLRVAESYENLALCALRQDSFDLALDYLKRALDHNSQRQSVLILTASIFYAKSELHKAEDVLKLYANKGFVSARGMLLEHLLVSRMGRLQYAQELETLLLQTYPNSVEARLVINNTLNLSEFEQLKEQYRTAQLDKITNIDGTSAVANPQIKIKRKTPKRISNESDAVMQQRPSRSLVTATVTSEATNAPANKAEKAPQTVSAASETFITDSPAPRRVQLAPPTQLDVQPVGTQTQQPVRFVSGAPEQNVAQVVFHRTDPSDIVFTPQVGLATHAPVQDSGKMLNEEIFVPKVPSHSIKMGENLFSLSVKYNIKLEKLLKWNALKQSDRLTIGQVIYLNDPNTTHSIVKGESLFDIAIKHKLLIDDLMRWNRLTPDVALEPGRRILIVDPNNYIL
ncbi:type IV pilus biogenesis/stability protein PilW [Pseudoalteromonas sp. SMS1]|uniref:type IV pilus biogenesis/stability protein PilW n=1 Tax=Pseudoalteromonas sp. SMS1 TaxID=2908894 RepID=UPI001F455640|nr:type IV pilus biogenesis/stability protein PilW [Pseudoalteromonas sp. SMS1]MCF2856885.1 type IV pilus biogenesis/stability protein PilW [Pseudoalteromonas sp. SMS1]